MRWPLVFTQPPQGAIPVNRPQPRHARITTAPNPVARMTTAPTPPCEIVYPQRHATLPAISRRLTRSQNGLTTARRIIPSRNGTGISLNQRSQRVSSGRSPALSFCIHA